MEKTMSFSKSYANQSIITIHKPQYEGNFV